MGRKSRISLEKENEKDGDRERGGGKVGFRWRKKIRKMEKERQGEEK